MTNISLNRPVGATAAAGVVDQVGAAAGVVDPAGAAVAAGDGEKLTSAPRQCTSRAWLVWLHSA